MKNLLAVLLVASFASAAAAQNAGGAGGADVALAATDDLGDPLSEVLNGLPLRRPL
jgi:hypothetical protein